MEVREAAYLSLVRIESGDKFSNLELDASIKKYGIDGQDKGFFTTLVYGVIEKRITLDYVIGIYSSKPIDKIEQRLLHILRLGAYQILFLDRTPDSAAVNESVELAKSYTHKGTSGFVNGVLRSIVRNKNNIPMPDKEGIKYLSVKYSCPEWLCSMWQRDYGREKCESILAAINVNPKITLRANTLRMSRDGLISILRGMGIECSPTPLSKNGVSLDEYTPVSDITPLMEGLCIVQDEASQLCSSALGACPGDFVIDTCSCPGGKSFGIGMDMKNEGRLLSLDLHESKLSLVKKGAERLGITILETAVHNGTHPCADLEGKADKVLCDVPCSGLGVIAKKPDLRHKSPTDIDKLPEIQYKILENASKYVKEGGVLVYSTCTLNRRENEDVVERFLSNNPSFVPSKENMPFGESSVTLFPDENGTDGFFVSRFVRKS